MVDFAALFDASPNPYMVLDRDLRYVAANRAYLAVTGRTREELIGARLTDLFPHDPDDPGNPNRRMLVASLERVLATGKPDVLPLIHYRIPIGGIDQDRYWSATHTPLLDEAGRVRLILQHTVDVTGLRVEQVIWNLLSNAVKFTPAGGRVTLSVEGRGDEVEIAVTDTGCGIAPELLPHVFERFRQAEGGSAHKLGGLGLGLSIARHVVEAHGGNVRAFSDGPGTGAAFAVRLPILPAAGTVLRAEPAGALQFEPPAALAGARVLVVDDEHDTREYLRMLLDRCQARVTVASTAAEALAALERERPDVLLSDIEMPGEDGYRLIQQVRALPADRGGRTPAVALTAHARSEDRTRALLAGFQNHVTKPIEPDELLAAVASLATRPEQR